MLYMVKVERAPRNAKTARFVLGKWDFQATTHFAPSVAAPWNFNGKTEEYKSSVYLRCAITFIQLYFCNFLLLRYMRCQQASFGVFCQMFTFLCSNPRTLKLKINKVYFNKVRLVDFPEKHSWAALEFLSHKKFECVRLS